MKIGIFGLLFVVLLVLAIFGTISWWWVLVVPAVWLAIVIGTLSFVVWAGGR